MLLDQPIELWRGRAADAALLGASSSISKDGNRQILLTSAQDVREICISTRKCINHWAFRAGSAHALTVAATRHPHSRVFFGVSGAPGVNASKKARQARRQETNKTTILPANEALAVWHDTDLDVAKWRRLPLQATAQAFAILTHSKLKDEVVIVFQDGSFASYNEDLVKGLQSNDAKVATSVEILDEDDANDQKESVVWSCLETDNRSPLKGALFLSILMQKTNQKTANHLDLLVYQVTIPDASKRLSVTLGAVLLIRHRVNLPDNEEYSSCAFHAETFSYSFIGAAGCWQSLRLSRDALTNALTLVGSQQMPNLTSVDATSSEPVHKKRKLQRDSTSAPGFLVSGIGNFTYLVSMSFDSSLKLTGWDSKFAVPVSKTEIDLKRDKDDEDNVVIGRSSNDGIGKPVQLVSVAAGDALLALYERGAFLVHVREKHSTLSSVLGATASTASISSEILKAPAMPDAVLQWTEVTATSTDQNDARYAETWKLNMCSNDSSERQLLADLSDPLVTPTARAFTSRLDEALQKEKASRKTGGEEGDGISYRLLQIVTRRCLDSTDLGLWKPLEAMLRTNQLSARSEPMLLPTLMKHNQFALLECAIMHLVDIDERSIVHLLKYFIRKCSNSALKKYVTKQLKEKKKNSSKVDGRVACERFVVALLGLPTNSVFLHRAIQDLELDEVLLLLAFCQKLLVVQTSDDYVIGSEEVTKSVTNKKSTDNSLPMPKESGYFAPLPSASTCCAWICALLDAHLSTLVLRASQSANIARTLRQLDQLVQLQLDATAQFESVHGVLCNILSGVQLPRAPGLPDYCIEELCL
ncbi:hypothetical protein CCR75_007883 [Bremia lactucae]|uniref:Nucleolar protein 11 C-terminal domain-containing protein n=1 Tax=Bremia lactucae TaxID=4779 RepID=A0A976IF08_BRELC|nr:hypothetical protein CCR75_007883 [Bremia lactucae]